MTRIKLPGGMKDQLLTYALGVADWMVRTQVKLDRSTWDANRGRFIYTRRRTTGQLVAESAGRRLAVSWCC